MQIKTIYKNLSYLYCQDSNFTHFVLSISLWHLLVKQLFMLGKFVYLPGSGQVDPSKIKDFPGIFGNLKEKEPGLQHF